MASTSRQLIRDIFDRKPAERCGFWLGMPHAETWPLLHAHFGTTDNEAIRRALGDDYRWLAANGPYGDSGDEPVWRFPKKSDSLGAETLYADCDSVQQIHDFPWPDADKLNLDAAIVRVNNAGDVYRASGAWSPFFHLAADFFGMEHYFMKMFTDPGVVHAATRHIVDYFKAVNDRFLPQVAGQVDGMFFGNDFGTQLDLLIGPKQFDEFVLPYFREFVEQARGYGLQVILHSCGSIHKVIDRLIAMGVDALHPLQARAADMDAETLAKDFGGRIAFVGGIDTQDLLVNAGPQQVRDEVARVRDALGPNLVISPSHECLLPNVPVANIVAMAEAAKA